MDKERRYRHLFAQCPKEVAAFATQFKPGHWCFLGPRQKIRGGTEIPMNLKENMILVAIVNG